MKTKTIFFSFFILAVINLNAAGDSLKVRHRGDSDLDYHRGGKGYSRSFNEIHDQLDEFEDSFLRKMNQHDQVKARRSLKEIHDLLDNLEERISRHSSQNDGGNYPPHSPVVTVIPPAQFNELLAALKKEPFHDTQARILRTAAQDSFFSVEQLKQIIEVFTFTDDKIEAVQIVYPSVLDKVNAYRIYDVFTFQSEKDRVSEIITNNK